jgi:hypothetical protein
MQPEDTLQLALSLIQRGEKAEGRALLRQVAEAEPYNPDVWFLYAKHCGKKEYAISALEHVLELDPIHREAAEALETLTAQAALPHVPAFTEETFSAALPAPASKASPQTRKKKAAAPLSKKMLIGLGAGALFSLLAVAGFAAFVFLGAPPQQETPPPPTLTVTPTITPFVIASPTPTQDPCTCPAVTAYLAALTPRLALAQADSQALLASAESLTAERQAELLQKADSLYQEQRGENIPACLDVTQKSAVRFFWNWQQSVNALPLGDKAAVQAFLDSMQADYAQTKENALKLGEYPSLQGCNLVLPP